MVRAQQFTAALSLVSAAQAYGWPQKRSEINDCLAAADVPFHTRGTEEWDTDSTAFNLRLVYDPAAIAVPRTTEHIAAAVKCGVKHGVHVSCKGGGHNYASWGFGGEDGHLVVELDRMSKVTVGKNNIAKIQGGARLGSVVLELLEQNNRALAHGTCPGVGIGGHVLGGGYGMATHTHGLTLDMLVGATVVLADGSVVRASKKEHSDLFWALRGASGGFGIVSEFEFETFEAPELVTVYRITTNWTQEEEVQGLKLLQDWTLHEMPRKMSMRLGLGQGPTEWEGNFYGSRKELNKVLKNIMKKAKATFLEDQTKETDWFGQATSWLYGQPLVSPLPYDIHEYFYANSLTAPYLSDEAIRNFVAYKYENGNLTEPGRGWWLQWDMHGGKNSALAAVDNKATAYAHRDQLWLWQFYDSISTPENSTAPYPSSGFEFLQGFVASLTDTLEDDEVGKYVNYPDSTLDKEEAQKLYWRDNLSRLQKIKAKYDPNEVFWHPASVNPAK